MLVTGTILKECKKYMHGIMYCTYHDEDLK